MTAPATHDSALAPASAAPAVGDLIDRDWPHLAGHDGEPASALSPEIWDQVLLNPIRDIVGRPGKSFRARLVGALWRLVDPRRAPPADLGAALELLHAGSLIVDDIEDDSWERRGGPALHRQYGLPRALNAGNFMYFWALDLLSRVPMTEHARRQLGTRALHTMLDCHRGQALDLGLSVGQVGQADVGRAVAETTRLKTGALTSLAAFAGAVAAGGNDAQAGTAARFGMALGIALQKLDDLGNLVSRHAPGKRHEDLRTGRLTWAWAFAAQSCGPPSFARLEAGAVRLRELVRQGGHPGGGRGDDDGDATGRERVAAEIELASGRLSDDLRAAVGLHRRRELRAELDAALGDLRRVFGPGPVLGMIHDEIDRLEASYG